MMKKRPVKIFDKAGNLICEELFYKVRNGLNQVTDTLLDVAAYGECVWKPGYSIKDTLLTPVSFSLTCAGACEIIEKSKVTVAHKGEIVVYKRHQFKKLRTFGKEVFRKKVLILSWTPFQVAVMDSLFVDDITCITLGDPGRVEEIFDRIGALFKSDDDSRLEEINVEAFRFLQELKKQLNDVRYPHEYRLALQYLNAVSGMKVDREMLAKVCNMSVSSLTRMFRKYANTSPGSYIINCRFETARRLLEQTDMPIKQIALECGFTNQKHFSSSFRNRFGRSPSEHRHARA